MAMDREAWQEMLRGLSLEEFQSLKEMVWEEARAREAQHLSRLRTGDWVEFEDRSGTTLRGTVTRINARTISVDCAPREPGGHPAHWRVGASLVRRIVSVQGSAAALPEPEARLLRGEASRAP
jgi:hypothetical protein